MHFSSTYDDSSMYFLKVINKKQVHQKPEVSEQLRQEVVAFESTFETCYLNTTIICIYSMLFQIKAQILYIQQSEIDISSYYIINILIFIIINIIIIQVYEYVKWEHMNKIISQEYRVKSLQLQTLLFKLWHTLFINNKITEQASQEMCQILQFHAVDFLDTCFVLDLARLEYDHKTQEAKYGGNNLQ